MNGIKALNTLLQGMLNGLKVETSGIWSYIKLPNGIAVCWGITSATLNCTSVGLGGYYHPTGVYTDLPSGLFTATPVGAATAYGDGVANVVQARPFSATQFYWNILSLGSGAIPYTVNLFAIGRWK